MFVSPILTISSIRLVRPTGSLHFETEDLLTRAKSAAAYETLSDANASGAVFTITTQPADKTVTVGQTAKFSVTATGTTPLSYQWTKNGTNITGATGASYTTSAATTADDRALFTVTVSNSVRSVTSVGATLTVNLQHRGQSNSMELAQQAWRCDGRPMFPQMPGDIRQF